MIDPEYIIKKEVEEDCVRESNYNTDFEEENAVCSQVKEENFSGGQFLRNENFSSLAIHVKREVLSDSNESFTRMNQETLPTKKPTDSDEFILPDSQYNADFEENAMSGPIKEQKSSEGQCLHNENFNTVVVHVKREGHSDSDSNQSFSRLNPKKLPLEQRPTIHYSDEFSNVTNCKGIQLNIKLFNCDLCTFASNLECNLDIHKFIHSSDKLLKCDQCCYVCCSKDQLFLHKKTHSSDKLFKCDHCSYTCCSKYKLNLHNLTHTPDKPFKCDECHYDGYSKYSLDLHKLTHSPSQQFNCALCLYANGCIHQPGKKHFPDKSFKCDQCRYTNPSRYKLNLHMSVHSPEMPFKCDQCSYTCTSNYKLYTHKLIHSSDKPFKCDQCPYTNKSKQPLKNHMFMHFPNVKRGIYSYGSFRKDDETKEKLIHLRNKLLKIN